MIETKLKWKHYEIMQTNNFFLFFSNEKFASETLAIITYDQLTNHMNWDG